MPEPEPEPIDAVYLWVDGADPEFQRSLAAHDAGRSGEAAGPRRFRDNGELRYSLRSLEGHAPWIRKVFLVTNGQAPDWLDTSSGRLEVVPHEAIFPDPRALPTFNSHAIELHLHRIPGLSQRFLSLNDDFFLGRQVTLDDFLTPEGGQRFLFEAHPLPADRTSPHPLIRASAGTLRLLDRLHGPQPFRPFPAHAPRLLDRGLLSRLEERLAVRFAAARSRRFRSGVDLPLWILYPFHLLESPARQGRDQGMIYREPTPEYAFFMLHDDFAAALQVFAWIARFRPRFFCFNDDLDDVPANHPVLTTLRGLLGTLFPNPSCFEKTCVPERAVV